MNQAPSYNEEEKIEIVRQYLNGGDLLRICEEYKINPIALHSWRKRLTTQASMKPNTEEKPRRKNKTATEIQEILALVNSGEQIKDVAAAYDISPSTIWKWRQTKTVAEKPEVKKEIIVASAPKKDFLIPTQIDKSRVKELQNEVDELKTLVANLVVENNRLKRRTFH